MIVGDCGTNHKDQGVMSIWYQGAGLMCMLIPRQAFLAGQPGRVFCSVRAPIPFVLPIIIWDCVKDRGVRAGELIFESVEDRFSVRHGQYWTDDQGFYEFSPEDRRVEVTIDYEREAKTSQQA